jgi:hypothetical protein
VILSVRCFFAATHRENRAVTGFAQITIAAARSGHRPALIAGRAVARRVGGTFFLSDPLFLLLSLV